MSINKAVQQKKKSPRKTDRLVYNKVQASEATFRGGLNSPFHRWFRLTPSFGPELVEIMLAEMETLDEHVVLDPFAGKGTTLIECKFNQIASYGFEINPILHFASMVGTNWDLDYNLLWEKYNEIKEIFFTEKQALKDIEVEDIGIPLPVIHNVFRWWRRDVLKDLLILRTAINVTNTNESVRNFFLLGLAGVLVPDLTNVTLGRLQLHFIDRTNDNINVWEIFSNHIERMISDIKNINPETINTPATTFLIDSTSLEGVELSKQIDRVITSPPYPNRYSYVWNTRPHLYFFNFLSNSKQAADLDKIAIGGTWGTATSILSKGTVEPLYSIIEKKVFPISEQIRERDNLMANYVTKYFNLLAKHIIFQDKLLSDYARCAYVVGCSRIKGIFIETDKILGEIFEGLDLGYKIHKIERIRKRHSDKDLYESIVYVYKGCHI